MTVKTRILTIVVTLSVIIVAVCIISTNIIRTRENQPLILKAKDDHIALYKGDRIIEEYDDIDIRMLTDYDRYLLRNGIEVTDRTHLLSILEDYD